jgi:hypothetical protein
MSEEELRMHWMGLAESGVKGDMAKAHWADLFGYTGADAAKFEDDIERIRTLHTSSDDGHGKEAFDSSSYYTNPSQSEPFPADPAGLTKESHPFIKAHIEDLNNETFDKLWAKGEPMVVDGLDQKFRTQWAPEDMVANFGEDVCGESSNPHVLLPAHT